MKAAAELLGGGLGPEGETYLLFGASLGLREQVEKQFARFLNPTRGVERYLQDG